MAKATYEVIFPNTSLPPYFAEVEDYQASHRQVCDEAARHRDIGYSERGQEERRVPVRVFKLGAKDGALTRSCALDLEVVCPLRPFDAGTFGEAETAALKDVPPEFARWISQYAYEQSHSAGYEEVYGTVLDLASELEPIIQQYTDRVLKGVGY